MPAIKLDGTKIAADIRADIAARLKDRPRLDVVLVGADPASQVYVDKKMKACSEVGITTVLHTVAPQCDDAEMEDILMGLNHNPDVTGILVQSPLPAHMDRWRVYGAIHPLKDVDCFHHENVGRLAQGRPRFLPCTPQAVLLLLDRSGIAVAGKHVVVINRSHVVGRPLAVMLVQADATVTVCHDQTPPAELKRQCLAADIIVVAVGIPNFLTPDMVRPGSVVVDVGITRIGPKVVGDAHPGVWDVAGWASGVPGGVGPLTVACLLLNVMSAQVLPATESIYDYVSEAVYGGSNE